MSSWPTRPTKSTTPPRPGGKNGRSYRMCSTQTRE
uniref:Uncharacterized protein n=1 Tax=Saimiri boliviensis boliviensis TaxID=39432 RepID=A0A2K6TZ15_SAIBB